MDISQGAESKSALGPQETHDESLKTANVVQSGAVEYTQANLKRSLAQRHLVGLYDVVLSIAPLTEGLVLDR